MSLNPKGSGHPATDHLWPKHLVPILWPKPPRFVTFLCTFLASQCTVVRFQGPKSLSLRLQDEICLLNHRLLQHKGINIPTKCTASTAKIDCAVPMHVFQTGQNGTSSQDGGNLETKERHMRPHLTSGFNISHVILESIELPRQCD